MSSLDYCVRVDAGGVHCPPCPPPFISIAVLWTHAASNNLSQDVMYFTADLCNLPIAVTTSTPSSTSTSSSNMSTIAPVTTDSTSSTDSMFSTTEPITTPYGTNDKGEPSLYTDSDIPIWLLLGPCCFVVVCIMFFMIRHIYKR